jgi:hypothetical protein
MDVAPATPLVDCPAGHTVQSSLPLTLYEPTGHRLHQSRLGVPVFTLKVPAGQGVQALMSMLPMFSL